VDAGLRQRHPDGLLWTRAEFDAARVAISAGLMDALYATVTTVTQILTAQREVERAIAATTSMAVLSAVADARAQLVGLLFPGFISSTGMTQLRHLPRYLRGITSRLDKLPTDVARDRVWMLEVQNTTARYTAAGGRIPLAPDSPEHIVRARWMLEELRISLFAQHLGTAGTVSPQRIQKVLAP
jgi:ATP-dependent helicase HrpA